VLEDERVIREPERRELSARRSSDQFCREVRKLAPELRLQEGLL
jgi:hypothetical protein